MKFYEVLAQIKNQNGRMQKFARRTSWNRGEQIGYGFNENDLLQTPILLKEDEKMNINPYTPSQNDINANDWEII